MGNLRKSVRKLLRGIPNAWATNAESKAALERTFTVVTILNTLTSRRGVDLREDCWNLGLGLLAERRFLLNLDTWAGKEGVIPKCDWKHMTEELNGAMQVGTPCTDPVLRGIAAFLYLVNLCPDHLATVMPGHPVQEEVAFGLICLLVQIALCELTAFIV